MTVTPTSLTRAAGISAAVAGLLFIAVQIKHPPRITAIRRCRAQPKRPRAGCAAR